MSNYIAWNDPRNPNNPANQQRAPMIGQPGFQYDPRAIAANPGQFLRDFQSAGGLGNGFASPNPRYTVNSKGRV
jgi:hypothetical protein